jgi:hypothetical protein
MKHKLIPLVLALTMMSWAQSTPPNQEKAAPEQAKSACPCCEKMASEHGEMHKGMHACMHANAAGKDSKEAMSCCAGKDAKGEMGCCGKDGKACAKENQTAKGEKSSMACCGANCQGHDMACCSHKDGDAASHGCCQSSQCKQHEHATTGN